MGSAAGAAGATAAETVNSSIWISANKAPDLTPVRPFRTATGATGPGCDVAYLRRGWLALWFGPGKSGVGEVE